jgi:hypothetical protein
MKEKNFSKAEMARRRRALPERYRGAQFHDRMPQIARIGFFHFVKYYDQPILSLEDDLQKCQPSEIDGSLIVLPETFNLARYYRDAGPFLNDLADLSRRPGAVFVVSVLEATPMCRLPYNSAYLVTPDNGQTMEGGP